MQPNPVERDPDGFLDYERHLSNLTEYEVVSTSPMHDPLKLSRSRVVAPSPQEGWEYLLEAVGWGPRTVQRSQVLSGYLLIPKGPATYGQGMSRSEWTHAVLLGYLPNPVRLAEGSRTADETPKPVEGHQRRRTGTQRKAFLVAAELFFQRQEQFPRTWKAVGILLAIVVGVVAIWMFWQVLLSLLGLYVLARGLGAYLKGVW